MIVLQNDQNVVSRSFASQQQCQIVAEDNNAKIKSINDKFSRDFAACGDPIIVVRKGHNGSGWNFGDTYSQQVSPQIEQCRVSAVKSNTIPKTKSYYCIAG